MNLARVLRRVKSGLLLSPEENSKAPWVLFESGVLWKALPGKRCCTLLCDLKSTDVSGPLAQFQATSLEREDMFRLVCTINGAEDEGAVDEARLERWFDQCWDDFESKCQEALKNKDVHPTAAPPRPDQRELLEEVVATVRRIAQTLSEPRAVRAERWPDLQFTPQVDRFFELLRRLPPNAKEAALEYIKDDARPDRFDLVTQALPASITGKVLRDQLPDGGPQATREGAEDTGS